MRRGKITQTRYHKAFFLSVLLGLCLFTRAQQPYTIKGKTTDDKGKELPGVSIAIKGLATGTSSDGQALFDIRVSTLPAILVFSNIAHQATDVSVRDAANLNLVLKSASSQLTNLPHITY